MRGQNDWPPKIDAISGRIFFCAGDQLGIDYEYADGRREAHPITLADIHFIRRLKWAGSPSYSHDRVRVLATKQGL
jgi:hypothetical protein